MKSKLRFFKIIIALGLLAFLFIKIDIVESLSFFSHIDLFSIIAIFLVTFWLIFVSVLKWRIFLNSLNLFNRFWSLYSFYIVGYFFSNFLPSNIGGDVVRITLAAKGKETYTSSFVAVFLERFTGIIATLLFVSLSLPLALWNFEFFDSMALILLPTIVILIFLAGLFFIRHEYIDRFIPAAGLVKKIFEKLKEVLTLIQSFKSRKQVLWKAMFLSIIFNLLAIVNVYVVAIALNMQVKVFDLFILVPLILLISSIPLSINAIGIAEGAYVLCLSLAGLSASEALSIALLMRAKTLAVSLLGGFLFLGYRKQQEF